ncbi:hypothetical protein [Agrococcus sp. ARC_14]|uniref:hypothetical protein n=1 Tax=Agrococcus sp. ARC_14 TaxID=2919927 RepID=UPI001F068AE1|nr:hypothetical protein [Agrococcus sp. ARC_14]MCH1882529.1 hypothetical protein [Agrococcus sp. ARC_14]
MGIELSTGRAWVGVDQQVGHGSADALFALTDEQYLSTLAAGWMTGSFLGECWRGEHDDLLLFHPGGARFRPEQWFPRRARMLPPKLAGELWWHVDALGEPLDGERAELSRGLAGGTARETTDADGVRSIAFRLVGDGAYPRPAALIAGLTAGSDRKQARVILGAPVDASGDVFAIEGERIRLGFVGDGLVEVSLERVRTPPPPGGPIGVFLAALGEPEQGRRFQAAAQLAGERSQRWMASSSFGRRVLVFTDGVEMQVQDDRVLSVRLGLSPGTTEPSYRHAAELVPGVPWPATRADLHRALGAPVDSSGGTDLHRFGHRDLLIGYGVGPQGEAPTQITAVLSGVSISHGIHRWRSGDFTLFLDILGRASSNPLVAHVRGLRGVRLRMRGDVVAAVELDASGERFVGFIDGLPADPRRKDIPFGAPAEYGKHDDLWAFEQGWVHVRADARGRIACIVVSIADEVPDGLAVRPWMFGRDHMDEWRQLSSPR